jgi:hypothetical protein
MATDYQSIENFAVPQAIDATSTVQNNPLGLIVRARDGGSTQLGVGEFIYLPGVASTVVGSAARIIESSTGTPALPGYATELFAAATTVGAMGVSMSANVASQYGWYQISGLAKVHVIAASVSTAAMILEGEPVYPSTTAGAVTDNATGTAANVFITSASFSKIPTAVPASPTFVAPAAGGGLLDEALDISETGVDVDASHGWTAPFVLKVDDEQMYAYVAATTNTFTVLRGINGSAAATHADNTAYTGAEVDVTTDPQHLYIRINRPVSQGTAI